MNLEEFARLASGQNLGTFLRSATRGPWWCTCGEYGDTKGGYGSCSRCGRKSREQAAHDTTRYYTRIDPGDGHVEVIRTPADTDG
jgi:hypothetical protein